MTIFDILFWIAFVAYGVTLAAMGIRRLVKGKPLVDPFPQIDAVKTFKLEPGSVVVVECTGAATPDQCDRLSKKLNQHVFPDCKVVLLGPGMTLRTVLEPKNAPAGIKIGAGQL